MIEIYCDGAYASSRNQGGWAYVVLKDRQKIYSKWDGVLDTTNNRMEIEAAYQGCLWAKMSNNKNITIYTDSMYVIGTMTMNWKKNKNLDLWPKLFDVVEGLNITWKHVKGHSGDQYNELCDVFAVEGSKLKLN